MREFVEWVRPYAEVLGFFAQLVLLYLVYKGLRQIELTREQIELTKQSISVTNERASKERAIEYLNYWAQTVIPAAREFGAEATAAKVLPNYDGPVGDFTPDSVPEANREMAAKRAAVARGYTFRNVLEVFAVAFTSGVADERLGFDVNGRAFCGMVASQYDVIARARTNPVYDFWKPIVELYKLWSSRLTQKELDLQRQKIDSDMAALATPPPVLPIGVGQQQKRP